MLLIKNLHAVAGDKEILKGVNLTLEKGQIHVIMGPNGAGKSTLAKVLAGDPSIEVTQGEVVLESQNILELDPEERAHLGVFMSFQYPPEIGGISNVDFLYAAYNAKRKSKGQIPLSIEDFSSLLQEKMEKVQVKKEFKDRNLNEGFSGGEKKRNEILQMAILEPIVSILDETDSGLDIDALRIVAQGINQFHNSENTLLLITHYQRLLDYVEPDRVHVMMDGRIVESGDKELAKELERKGYDWLNQTQEPGYV